MPTVRAHVHAQHELASYFKGRDQAAKEVRVVCQESAQNVHRAMDVLRGLDRMTTASCASKQLAGELLSAQRAFIEKMMKHGVMSDKNAHRMLEVVEADEEGLEEARHYQARAVGRMVCTSTEKVLNKTENKADRQKAAKAALRSQATFTSSAAHNPVAAAMKMAVWGC